MASADIQLTTGAPNTRYDVRLIQLPRSSALSCNAADPGVAATALFTDAAGAGPGTVRGPIMSGGTGAWVSITLPNAYSQVPDDFYSTETVAAFSVPESTGLQRLSHNLRPTPQR